VGSVTTYDVVVKNGRVIVGDGSPWIAADVAIKDGRIVKVGYLKRYDASRVIDASGKFVAPGFIDMHNHSDLSVMAYPEATSTLLQGVTTIVVGNCGFSAAPVARETKHLLERYWSTLGPLPVEITWSTFGEYLRRLEEVRPAVNVATLVGHGVLRIAVMGFDARAPTEVELGRMKELVREAMESGAFGMSSGLIYPPGSFSSTEELVELARVVAEYGGIYSSHIRGESYTLVEAVREAIEIGSRSGAPVEISHHKAAGRDNWGRVRETLRMMEEARSRGVEVTCDAYPYTAGMTMLAACIPRWAHEGGVEALLSRLKDPDTRRKIRDYIETEVTTWENFVKLAGWEGIVVSYSETCKECEGRSLAEISRSWGVDPYDSLFDLLTRDGARTTMVVHLMREEDVVEVLKHPLTMVGSDSWVTPPVGKPHPRFFGTFPRIIKRYVKDLGVLRLEEAIAKMTSMPARKLRLGDRGLVAPGFKADVVVFDFNKVEDRATYENPTQPPVGIEYVLVNGVVAVEEGVPTKARSGEVLRRSG
jgi:N-acyl-D-amino-acid deacylase